MSNLNESFSDMESDAPNRHARRTVESLIADHVADAIAIEYVAYMIYARGKEGVWVFKWKCLDEKVKRSCLMKAKREVLDWLNSEQGTDYQLED